MKRKALRDHIEKPEDKIWKQWFERLTPKDHENYLAKLGLSKEDQQDLPEIEEQLHSINKGEKQVLESPAKIQQVKKKR